MNHGKNQQTANRKTKTAQTESKTNRSGQTQIGRTEVKAGEELLLHVCCAPCATYVIDVLSERYTVTAFFYNPNIHPAEEYERRLLEVRRYTELHDTPLIVAEDDAAVWHERIRGFEQELEGGKRCEQCFRLRLEKTAATAAERDIALFTTTLSISPHKDFSVLHAIGSQAAERFKRSFLARDFKKNDGYKKSCQLSQQYGLYRQRYCGCVYSMKDRSDG